MERNVPRDQWLYDDRGMMKWMGWILSDHSAYMEAEAKREAPTLPKTEMTSIEIDRVLQQAWKKSEIISVQKNIEFDQRFEPNIEGALVGNECGLIYVQGKDNHAQEIEVAEIRHVEIIDAEKWWLQ
ncbi:DNA-directed RNA polymerase subunit beta [Lapidilactobacillus mulanensis]|uniref:DNA-directed RNA polymerase subunit beta n=1 Tax=Lapidilactobacillus mulanensis TaxID=2485999 RepID=A0ABW4DPP5_9LACO|nr:DNA-directed RNA polymerase subunit beta [Lapidilactobacillus mulanensis]